MKVSIIIPVYNGSGFLKQTVKNVLNQTYRNLEIVLIDDGSEDNTRIVGEKLKKKFNNIKYYYQKNKGPGAARNKGLKYATGDYVMFLDVDDKFSENMVEELLRYALKHDADVVQAGYYLEKDEGFVQKIEHVDEVEIVNGSYESHLEYAKSDKMDVYLWSKMFKRSVIKHILFPNYYYTEDQHFIIKVLENVDTVVIIPEAYYTYKYNPKSIVRSDFSLKKLDSIKATKANIQIYDNIYPELSGYYHKKLCLYIIKFFRDLKRSDIQNKDYILLKMEKDYNESYAKYKNSIAVKDSKISIELFLWSFRYFPQTSYILLSFLRRFNIYDF